MEKSEKKTKQFFLLMLLAMILVQLITVFYFCAQKEGFHYDEYYSYYSSNVTYGLVPSDMEWKSTQEIKSEFAVAEDARFSYQTVNLMQSYDVHPPLFYFLLHTVCSLTPGVFSKWQGMSINIVFFLLTWLLLAKIASDMTGKNRKLILAVCLLYGFSPAVYSGITFIRMYMMMTFFCLLMLYIHGRALILGRRTWYGFYLPVLLVSFLGFYTHYYFIVFLFFLAAATFLSMAFHKESRKQAPCYAASVIGGMLLTVMAYPVCLSHIFRGYRGTEAMDAFFDLGNLMDRISFFINLMNEYVLCNFFFLLLLILLLLIVTCRYRRMRILRTQNTAVKNNDDGQKQYILVTALTVIGYFLVVAKTALLNAEEAIRYEMPVYGLIILLLVLCLHICMERLKNGKNDRALSTSFYILIIAALAMQITGLMNQKVLFLYPQDAANVAWASQHETEPVVYIYNPINQWMIWDDSEELMQYDEIYFINMENTTLKQDTKLDAADRIYVYAVRNDNCEKLMQELMEQNGTLRECVKIRELLYCDLYELK